MSTRFGQFILNGTVLTAVFSTRYPATDEHSHFLLSPLTIDDYNDEECLMAHKTQIFLQPQTTVEAHQAIRPPSRYRNTNTSAHNINYWFRCACFSIKRIISAIECSIVYQNYSLHMQLFVNRLYHSSHSPQINNNYSTLASCYNK